MSYPSHRLPSLVYRSILPPPAVPASSPTLSSVPLPSPIRVNLNPGATELDFSAAVNQRYKVSGSVSTLSPTAQERLKIGAALREFCCPELVPHRSSGNRSTTSATQNQHNPRPPLELDDHFRSQTPSLQSNSNRTKIQNSMMERQNGSAIPSRRMLRIVRRRWRRNWSDRFLSNYSMRSSARRSSSNRRNGRTIVGRR